MFMRYDTQPARLLRLFRAFYGQALRLRIHRRIYGVLLLVALLAYAVAVSAIFASLGEDSARLHDFFGLFSLAGGAYLLLAWGLAVLFSGYPHRRTGLSAKFALAVALLIGGAFSLAALSDAWDGLGENPLLLLAQADTREIVILPWALASLGLFLLTRGIVWMRFGAIRVETFELDYLSGILKPLLRDLPADARCTLTCNPFSSIWSAGTVEDGSLPPYSFQTCDDLLLDFRVEWPQGPEFRLRTLHRRVEKYKRGRKKLKYKATKHRIVQAYRFQIPSGLRLDERQRAAIAALPGRLCDAAYQAEIRNGESSGRLCMVQKHKFSGWNRELEPADLPSANLTLGTIRQMSTLIHGFSATALASGQSPRARPEPANPVTASNGPETQRPA